MPSAPTPHTEGQGEKDVHTEVDMDEATADFVMPPMVSGPGGLSISGAPAPWLWHGMLAPGAITLMTSQWKAGKTTLATILLTRMQQGGEFLGLALRAGRAVVVTEENTELWDQRHKKHRFGENLCWYCRPFRGKPSMETWRAFLHGLAAQARQQPYDLLLIDPLAKFLPGSENHAGSIVDGLAGLDELTALNVSVLILHHPTKNEPAIGLAARGSGALPSVVDIIIEMRRSRKERRRLLWAWSRYPETPSRCQIELTADGLDYVACPSADDELYRRRWRTLAALFAEAPHRHALRMCCCAGQPGRSRPIASRCAAGWKGGCRGPALQGRRGKRGNPCRYWLPAREAEWRCDPLALCLMPELRGTEPTNEPCPPPSRHLNHVAFPLDSGAGRAMDLPGQPRLYARGLAGAMGSTVRALCAWVHFGRPALNPSFEPIGAVGTGGDVPRGT